jgi:hypothetical protein
MAVRATVRPVASRRRDRPPSGLLGTLLALIAALMAPPMQGAQVLASVGIATHRQRQDVIDLCGVRGVLRGARVKVSAAELARALRIPDRLVPGLAPSGRVGSAGSVCHATGLSCHARHCVIEPESLVFQADSPRFGRMSRWWKSLGRDIVRTARCVACAHPKNQRLREAKPRERRLPTPWVLACLGVSQRVSWRGGVSRRLDRGGKAGKAGRQGKPEGETRGETLRRILEASLVFVSSFVDCHVSRVMSHCR